MPDAIPGKLVAPEPVPPVRQYSFTDWQVNNPTAPPPGDRLDAEFDRTNSSLSQTLDWVGTSLNTDGTLRPGIVGEPQLVPGLFDHIADDAVDQVQPLVDQAGSYATQALGSANAALTYAGLAGTSSTGAGQSATDAQAAASAAQSAATGAQSSAASVATDADRAENAANHADGSEAVAQAYADVGMVWAEHMPDPIPPNILAVQGVTGDHWSSRWWANRALETFSDIEDLLAQAPPLAVVNYYTYIATAGQTVFTGPDRDGKTLVYTPSPVVTLLVYANGLLRTPVNDYTGTANTVTFAQPRAAGDIVQIQVEGVATQAGQYLPLTGGTMVGAITLAGDPAGPLQPVTRQYSDGKYLPFAGGTLNGPLVLAANPVAPLGAATKQYVDTKAGAGLADAPNNTASYGRHGAAWAVVPQLVQVTTNVGFDLNTIGGTGAGPFTGFLGLYQLTNQTPAGNFPGANTTGAVLHTTHSNAGWQGQLFMGSAPAAGGEPNLYYRGMTGQGTFANWQKLVTAAGATLAGPLVLAADPTVPLGAATRQYTDTKLPLAGGTVTGNLSVGGTLGVQGALATNGTFFFGTHSAHLLSDANVTQWVMDGGNWRWEYNTSNGAMAYFRGSDNTAMFVIDGLGNIAATGGVAGASLSTSGSATVGGRMQANDIMSNSGTFYVAGNTNYYMGRAAGDGAWRWVENNAPANMTLDTGGNLTARGSVVADNLLVAVNGVEPDSTGNWRFYNSGGYRLQQYASNWAWSWNISTGQLAYSIPGGQQYIFSTVDYVSYNWLAGQAGTGPYIVTSDERTKADILPALHGLDTILAIEPVTFRRWHQAEKRYHDRVELGFGARQVQAVLPEAVVPMDAPPEWKALVGGDEPVLGVQIDPIVAALVNAVKELSARIDALTKGAVPA
jgi:Chaperone of endosialidase